MPYLDASYSLPFASGSDTSHAAAVRSRHFIGQQGEDVWRFVAICGARGATQKEIAASLQLGRPSVCARTRALELAGRLVKTTQRRAGCAVYLVAKTC